MKKQLLLIGIAIANCAISITNCQAQDYLADPSFNTGSGFDRIVYDIAQQTDGKLVISGDFTQYNGTPVNKICRLNLDGSLDNTFNTGTGFDNSVVTVKIQPDGKILAGGLFQNLNGSAAKYLVRLNSNGTLDNTFAYHTNSINADNTVRDIEIYPTGEILLGGSFKTMGADSSKGIARLTSSGVFDPTFNAGGKGFDFSVYDLIINPDNKITAGGYFSKYTDADSVATRFMIAQLNADGTLNENFTSGVYKDASITQSLVRGIELTPSGKVIAAGYFDKVIVDTAMSLVAACQNLVRLSPAGIEDQSWTNFPDLSQLGGDGSPYRALKLGSNGKLYVGGEFMSAFNSFPNNCFARMDTAGNIDYTFNMVEQLDSFVRDIFIQQDGKILLGGQFTQLGTQTANKIVRLIEAPFTSSYSITGTYCNSSATDISVDIEVSNSIAPDNSFIIEIGVNTDSFNVIAVLDSFPSATSGTYVVTTPSSLPPGYYSLRRRSTNPAYSQFDINNNILYLSNSVDVYNYASAAICQGETYLLPDGNYTDVSGNFNYNYTTTGGCDSTLFLEVEVSPIDTSIVVNGPVITANAVGASLQWIDCSNGNTPIPNETSQTYTVSGQGGVYAVIVTANGCSDTSGCRLVMPTDVFVLNNKTNISLYPNPTTGQFTLELPTTGTYQVEVFNTLGQVLYSSVVTNATKHTINIGNAPVGVYNVRVRNEKSSVNQIVIIN